MDYGITSGGFPLAQLSLNQGEKAYIDRGSMIYRSEGIKLHARLNSRRHGFGVGSLVSSLARSIASDESMLITEAVANSDGRIALASDTPGGIDVLSLGQNQYFLNDDSFLAMSGSAEYALKRQKISPAIFSGTGGFCIMHTGGTGIVLITAYGSIHKLHLEDDELTVDNMHVVDWSDTLDYNISYDHLGTGEGIVNNFSGTGDVYIQSLSLPDFAKQIYRYLPDKYNQD